MPLCAQRGYSPGPFLDLVSSTLFFICSSSVFSSHFLVLFLLTLFLLFFFLSRFVCLFEHILVAVSPLGPNTQCSGPWNGTFCSRPRKILGVSSSEGKAHAKAPRPLLQEPHCTHKVEGGTSRYIRHWFLMESHSSFKNGLKGRDPDLRNWICSVKIPC